MTGPFSEFTSSYRVNIVQTYLGRTIVNSLGYRGNEEPFTEDGPADAIASMFRDAWIRTVLKVQHPSVTLTAVDVQSLDDKSYGSRATANAPGAGTASTYLEPLSSALCAKVTLSTGKRGRRFSGRTGMVGLGEGIVLGNELVELRRGQIASEWQALIAGVRTGGLEAQPRNLTGNMAVISETYRLSTPVTSSSVALKMGTRVARFR